jgi:hypothetical protein
MITSGTLNIDNTPPGNDDAFNVTRIQFASATDKTKKPADELAFFGKPENQLDFLLR